MFNRTVSGIVLTLLLVNLLGFALNTHLCRASPAIYIRADGSIDPPTAPIERSGNIYTLLSDILEMSIVVEKDDITLDGNGHALQTFQTLTYGVDLSLRRNVKVTRMIVNGFYYCIRLDLSSHNNIINNTVIGSREEGISLTQSDCNYLTNNKVVNSTWAIFLYRSKSNILYGNKVSHNVWGIFVFMGTNCTLRNNKMTANKYNFYVGDYYLSSYLHDIDSSNTADGKPIYYLINRNNQVIPKNVGYVTIVNSSRVTAKDLILKNNFMGLTLAFCSNSLIENVTSNESGIALDHSDMNLITRNKAYNCYGAGINLFIAYSNTVSYNTIANTTGAGIWLEDTYRNKIIGNNVAYTKGGSGPQEFDGGGILVDDSPYCEVTDNVLTNNSYGVVVGALASSHNIITGNNIAGSNVGLILFEGKNNVLYHNSFRQNVQSVLTFYETKNTLDNGYSSGGNYWSDYTGWDENNDGIGDVPYVIDENNRDNYPLMSPYGMPSLPTCTLTMLSSTGGTTNPLPGNYRHSQGQKIPVQAIPDADYQLDHWELDGINMGTSDPVTITMNSSHSLRAIFTVPTYSVTMKAHCNSESADVGVDITLDGLPTSYTTPHTFVGLTGEHTFTLPSHDANNHLFKQWNTGQNSTTITVNSNGTYVASYDAKYSLLITSTVEGNTDPEPDVYTYWSGTVTGFKAIPTSGYYLDYWQFDSVNIGAPNPVKVEMNTNHTLHAVFTQLSSGHDVAIKYIDSKTVVGQGHSLTINVTVMNVGNHAEAFNVTVCINTIPIALKSVSLESATLAILSVEWNTTGFAKGNHTISAYAWPVENETDTLDNNFTDGWVIVAMPGDITGSPSGYPDGIVDMKDMSTVAKLFGVEYPNARYNPNCDIIYDLTIDMKDISFAAQRFGQEDP